MASLASSVAVAQASNQGLSFTELSRKEINVGDHTITLVRVRPPAVPEAGPPPTAPSLTAEDQATADRLANKAYALLNVSATVYVGGGAPITELRWRDESGACEYRAYSNANFLYLTQVSQLEAETTVYGWYPLVEVISLSDWPAGQASPLPEGLEFSPTQTEYYLDSRAKEVVSQETLLAGLDYLHAYYQLHCAELKTAYEKREAENAERERQLRENPPKTADVTLRFWPIKSSTNPQ
jgi:hypothetical protein